jgi:ADP-ribosylglycohydrolase
MKDRSSPKPRNEADLERYVGCLIGGAVGDALGAPVEFMSNSEIAGQFGPGGIQEYAPVFGRVGAITDDTQMTLFTAEGVVRSWVRAYVHAPCAIPGQIARAYQRWLHTQGLEHLMHNHCLNGWLITHKNLFNRRAPGSTCLSGLQSMKCQDDVAKNTSKGCGGVMRVAPVGMYYATLAAENDANQSALLNEAFATGCRSAAITHGHRTGQLASGAFAAIVMLLLTGAHLRLAVTAIMPMLAAHPDHEETTGAIEHACLLAKDRPNDAGALRELGGGWVAEEALAMALYCALSAPDFRSGVVLAVNHGGDSDSTGSMAGQLLGAMYGTSAIPNSWRMPLELGALIEAVAYDLAVFSKWRPSGTNAPDVGSARYQSESNHVEAAAEGDLAGISDPFEGVELPAPNEERLENQEAVERALSEWEQDFRADAKADDHRIFRAHLRRLELPDEPELLLEGTILVVQMSLAYLALDNQEVQELLAQQRYEPTAVVRLPYQLTFDIHGKAYGRINVSAEMRQVDLADLYATPWHAYNRVGYRSFWISRVDGAPLSPQEITDFEKTVNDDLRFDYCEEEVDYWFDPDTYQGFLRVIVQDVYEEGEDV